MSRVYNFSAGPAVLPEPVLKEVAAEMMDYQGSGMSVMEMSHRSPEGIIPCSYPECSLTPEDPFLLS
mgnify:CR=1 FL=1